MSKYNERQEYEDIINLPHPISKKHPPMSAIQRGAQFAPFAALDGHGDAVVETARLSDVRIELDENKRAELNRKLRLVLDNLDASWKVQIMYFIPDVFKEGGTYRMVTGVVKKVDDFQRQVVMQSGDLIPIEDIIEMESEAFPDLTMM